MLGPCSAAGTSLPSRLLGVAVTKPRQFLGSSFQPLLGTGFPFPHVMPKKDTRMLSMVPGFGVGVGVGTGDGDGAWAGAVTGGAGLGPATGCDGASSVNVWRPTAPSASTVVTSITFLKPMTPPSNR